jgi:TATA-box binding protein (TBP) (component of TFIID and TFIIIB)
MLNLHRDDRKFSDDDMRQIMSWYTQILPHEKHRFAVLIMTRTDWLRKLTDDDIKTILGQYGRLPVVNNMMVNGHLEGIDARGGLCKAFVHIEAFAKATNCSEIDPKCALKCVKLRFKSDSLKNVTLRLFSSGSWTATGITSIEQIKMVVSQLLINLKNAVEADPDPKKNPRGVLYKDKRHINLSIPRSMERFRHPTIKVHSSSARISNIVASFSGYHPWMLNSLKSNGDVMRYVSYEPDLFPGAYYDLENILCVPKLSVQGVSSKKKSASSNSKYQRIKCGIFTQGSVNIVGAQTMSDMYRAFIYILPVLLPYAKVDPKAERRMVDPIQTWLHSREKAKEGHNQAPTTVQPTTVQPTTVQPTTEQPTTEQPTTVQPVQPTTGQPVQPTTVQPTTWPLPLSPNHVPNYEQSNADDME